jgi:hypothetical protein
VDARQELARLGNQERRQRRKKEKDVCRMDGYLTLARGGQYSVVRTMRDGRGREQPFNKEESKQEHRPPMGKKVWEEVNDGEE